MVLSRGALSKSKDQLAKVKAAVLSSAAREETTPLQLLRHNPDAAMGKFAFFVDTRGFTTTKEGDHYESGGPAIIKERQSQNSVTCLTIEAGGNDFYFPWVNGGVGKVIVPINPQDGTIVATGGMNGCALQVNQDDKYYYFYHDADGKNLGKLGQLPGKMVCRVDAASYYDAEYINSLLPKRTVRIDQFWVPMFQMICIHSTGKWKIMCSGIKLGNQGIPKGPLRPFKRGASPCLGTFA